MNYQLNGLLALGLWARGVDIRTRGGKVYQILPESVHPRQGRVTGFERLFRPLQSPTRREAGADEIAGALRSARDFTVFPAEPAGLTYDDLRPWRPVEFVKLLNAATTGSGTDFDAIGQMVASHVRPELLIPVKATDEGQESARFIRVPNRVFQSLRPPARARLEEMLAEAELGGHEGEDIILTRDFGRVIGLSSRVEAASTDEGVAYAQVGWSRDEAIGGLRPITGRFVKGQRRGTPCRHLTALLRPASAGWEVRMAYVGTPAPAWPGDRNAGEESVPFWRRHALLWGSVPVDPTTETTESPRWARI